MEETGYSSAIASPEILKAVTDNSIKEAIDLSYFFGPDAAAVHVDSVMYPKLSTIERCSFLRDSGDRQEVIREIWEKMKSTRVIDYWQIAIIGCLLGVLAIAIALVFRRIKIATTKG